MIQIDYKATKKRPTPGALRRMRLAAGLGVGLAEAIRGRQFDRGDPVDSAPAYDNDSIRLVSPRYPIVAQGRQADSGAIIYRSSAAFHANIRRGSYNVSAGLRDGMTVMIRKGHATIKFRGRSEGQDPNFRRYADGRVVAKGRKVSNALKAATVLLEHDVNVLKNSRAELAAMAQALEELSRQAVDAMLPVKTVWRKGRQGPLARRMVAYVNRGRGTL